MAIDPHHDDHVSTTRPIWAVAGVILAVVFGLLLILFFGGAFEGCGYGAINAGKEAGTTVSTLIDGVVYDVKDGDLIKRSTADTTASTPASGQGITQEQIDKAVADAVAKATASTAQPASTPSTAAAGGTTPPASQPSATPTPAPSGAAPLAGNTGLPAVKDLTVTYKVNGQSVSVKVPSDPEIPGTASITDIQLPAGAAMLIEGYKVTWKGSTYQGAFIHSATGEDVTITDGQPHFVFTESAPSVFWEMVAQNLAAGNSVFNVFPNGLAVPSNLAGPLQGKLQ